MTPLAYLRLIPGVIILVLIAWALRLEQLRARWQHQWQSEHAGRLADRGAYEQAQRDAEAHNKAQVAAVEQQQQRITDERTADLTDRLARLRRELSERPNPATQGAPGNPGASPLPDAPGGADGKAGLCLAPAELLRAAENEERHDQLITWVEQQLAVDPNHP